MVQNEDYRMDRKMQMSFMYVGYFGGGEGVGDGCMPNRLTLAVSSFVWGNVMVHAVWIFK